MRFWDSSALVPLCLDEPRTGAVKRLLDEDRAMIVWWASPVECWSAFARLRRNGVLDDRGEAAAREALEALHLAWLEVSPQETIRVTAGRLLRTHALTAADALRLAAALASAEVPTAGEIVVFDRLLEKAARLEGLTPIPESPRQ